MARRQRASRTQTHQPPPAAVGLLRGPLRFRRPATRPPDAPLLGTSGVRTAGRPSPPSASRRTWPTLYKPQSLMNLDRIMHPSTSKSAQNPTHTFPAASCLVAASIFELAKKTSTSAFSFMKINHISCTPPLLTYGVYEGRQAVVCRRSPSPIVRRSGCRTC